MNDRQGPPRPRIHKNIGHKAESKRPGEQAKQTAEPSKSPAASTKTVAAEKRRPLKKRPVAVAPATQGRPVVTIKVDMSQRIAERNRARRRLVLTRISVIMLAAGVVAATIWLFAFSRVFAFESANIEVAGLQSGEAEEVVLPVAGEYDGTPLVRVPVQSIKETLLTEPVVADVTVKRAWPRSLSVTVQRRAPAAVVNVGEESSLVGSDGVVLGPATGEEELPIIAVLGDSSELQADTVMGLEVWGVLPPGLRDQVGALEVRRGQVSLVLASGARVVWGDSTDAELKAEVLEILITNRTSDTYDVSDPARPVTR